MDAIKRLSHKQQRFIDAYLTCWNASEAARQAGYSAKTARVIGPENLSKPVIRAEIERRLVDGGIQAGEVIMRLSNIARASIADFLTTDAAGNVVIDAQAVARDEHGVLKRMHVKRDGAISIELHDAQAALVTLGEAFGVLGRNVRMQYGQPLEIVTQVVYERAMDDDLEAN